MKILIISSFPAPYRVDIFKEISKVHETTVFFETSKDENRNSEWFSRNSEFYFEVLDNEESMNKFQRCLKYGIAFVGVLGYGGSG